MLDLGEGQEEILIIDQTPEHDDATTEQLTRWHDQGDIRWLKREKPSITESMNFALQKATSSLVLFLDDDIAPYSGLLTAHRQCHAEFPDIWASVGQVIQPWQRPENVTAPRKLTGLRRDFDFPFHSTVPDWVANVMAGNLCVRRNRALQLGGFDEDFLGAAYRFESDFARRVIAAGGRIRFCPAARIDHLRVARGGTRQQGRHLTSADPVHGVGDHYYAMKHGNGVIRWSYVIRRMIREVSTKFHLTHPWWIPVKLLGEIRAVVWAAQLRSSQPVCPTDPMFEPTNVDSPDEVSQ